MNLNFSDEYASSPLKAPTPISTSYQSGSPVASEIRSFKAMSTESLYTSFDNSVNSLAVHLDVVNNKFGNYHFYFISIFLNRFLF